VRAVTGSGADCFGRQAGGLGGARLALAGGGRGRSASALPRIFATAQRGHRGLETGHESTAIGALRGVISCLLSRGALGLQGWCAPGCRKNFTPRFFAGGLFFLRNFSAPSMGDRGRGGPALCCTAPPRLRQRFVLRIGHLQNFQRLRAPLRARLRSPRATLAETARIRHLIEINRALGRTSALSVRITCFPTV
jgi:hypothetical protein